MSITSETHTSAELTDRIHDAVGVTAEFLADIIRATCRRFASSGQNVPATRIDRLIQSGAWTDTALALIELELPHWQVRRIAYDEDEWHCALSRQRELPEWLDSAIEARHTDLPLAILSAFVEARRVSTPESRASVPSIARDRDPLVELFCCENFA
jgi:hypothetical protein